MWHNTLRIIFLLREKRELRIIRNRTKRGVKKHVYLSLYILHTHTRTHRHISFINYHFPFNSFVFTALTVLHLLLLPLA